jgi:23S rRNA (adenine2503-C2)-methyltransferase
VPIALDIAQSSAHLADQDPAAFSAALAAAGFPASHASAILRAFYRGRGEIHFADLRIGPRLQTWLERTLLQPPLRSSILHRTTAGDGTVKLLIGSNPPDAVEAVLMPGHRPGRAAACVSSQVGCAMGCDFCASTRLGLSRNLAAGEIVEEFLHLSREAAAQDRRISSLVFMGMGEPMHNLSAVLAAIRRIADPDLGGLGWRQVTVSTVGIVPGIAALAEADLNVHLALSLHAPDDETRSRLIPANRRWPVAEVIAAAANFQQATRRIVTIEYCLLAGENDSDDQAILLAQLLAGRRMHVNVIPFNPIGPGLSGKLYHRPPPQRIARFVELLRDHGAVCHIRDTRGDDAAAACGQLRLQPF